MTGTPLTILILHRLGDPRTWRRSMMDHEFCLPKFAPGHNYLVHDVELPLPEYVKQIDFDGIVLTQTFLGRRRHPSVLRGILKDYAFIKDSPAFKIALPQDDYHCNEILDRWMVDWKVDLLYPVVSEHWGILYPAYRRQGRLRLGYTGLISEEMIGRWQTPKPIRERSIDVSYRASKLLPTHGRLGYLKGIIGERFVQAVEGRGLVLDISTDPKDVIVGSKWHPFLEDSKYVLGSNSGVSYHDPEGLICKKVMDYLVFHPGASFEEVEAACFPGIDGEYEFTAISPRNLECGLIESVQILTPGPYSNVMEAGTHYIPLDPEMRNIEEVLDMMGNPDASARMAKACKEALLSHQELRYQNHVAELIGEIANARSAPKSEASAAADLSLIVRYRKQIETIAPVYWLKRRVTDRVQQTLASMGLRRIKCLMTGSGRIGK